MKWINQKDGLPEVGTPVLLWVVYKNQPLWTTYKFGHWENGKWYLVGGTQYGDLEINFWQHLPEAPSKDLLSLCSVSNSALKMDVGAREFFIQEWGEDFVKVTLHGQEGLLELSMEDIYQTMERYADVRMCKCNKCK